ncbi:MAG: lasso peptide biosynthesis B2 protein [Xanthomonadaceae bacterium]|nr:lasso peptide biosynthesis B2 protein [Xanthomonadaceae bacterium]
MNRSTKPCQVSPCRVLAVCCVPQSQSPFSRKSPKPSKSVKIRHILEDKPLFPRRAEPVLWQHQMLSWPPETTHAIRSIATFRAADGFIENVSTDPNPPDRSQRVVNRQRPVARVLGKPVNGFQRYRALPKAERRELWSAAWRLIIVRLCLSTGIERTQRWLDGQVEDSCLNPAASAEHWQRRGVALKRVGHRLPGVACLAQAIALRWWMRSSGLDAQLQIGVRQDKNELKSHAWVELNRQPIDETPEIVSQFKTLRKG